MVFFDKGECMKRLLVILIIAAMSVICISCSSESTSQDNRTDYLFGELSSASVGGYDIYWPKEAETVIGDPDGGMVFKIRIIGITEKGVEMEVTNTSQDLYLDTGYIHEFLTFGLRDGEWTKLGSVVTVGDEPPRPLAPGESRTGVVGFHEGGFNIDREGRYRISHGFRFLNKEVDGTYSSPVSSGADVYLVGNIDFYAGKK